MLVCLVLLASNHSTIEIIIYCVSCRILNTINLAIAGLFFLFFSWLSLFSIFYIFFIQLSMITAKFGGTAITPRNLIHLKEILTPFHKCVVVSAVGKEYQSDTKTTDLLIEYHNNPTDETWSKIADKYRRLVEVNAIDVDVNGLLHDARSRALRYDLQYCMSLGEELSAKVVAAYLKARYLEAENVVFFDDGGLDVQTTYGNIQSSVKGADLAVVGGFYGGCNCGRRTFSRGGSDVSGSIFAAATNSTLYENWTDVSGVCVANPIAVADVETVSSMSYGEMYLLSLAGAEVLHPDAIAPVEEKGIPIKIGNFLQPYGKSTLVSTCPSVNKLLSIAEKTQDGKLVTTVLHSYPEWRITRLISKFLRQNTRTLEYFGKSREVNVFKLYNLEIKDNLVRLTTDVSILNPLYKCLRE